MSGSTTDRKPDRDDTPMIVLDHVKGTREITKDNDKEVMAVRGNQSAAMQYVEEGAKVTEKSTNSTRLMMSGYNGDEVAKIAAEVLKDTEESADASRKSLPQPKTRLDGGKSKKEIKISVRVQVNPGRIHTLGDRRGKEYSMPENATINELIKEIHDDLHIDVKIHLTNDKSGTAIQGDNTLKGVGITNGQCIYAFQYVQQVLSGGRSLKSSS